MEMAWLLYGQQRLFAAKNPPHCLGRVGLDVVSGGELYTAVALDSPERIYSMATTRPRPELVAALEYGGGTIVVDNLEELEMLRPLGCSKKKNIRRGNYAGSN